MKSKILFLYKIEYKGFLDCIEWNHFITRFLSFLLGKSYVGLNNDLFNKEKNSLWNHDIIYEPSYVLKHITRYIILFLN